MIAPGKLKLKSHIFESGDNSAVERTCTGTGELPIKTSCFLADQQGQDAQEWLNTVPGIRLHIRKSGQTLEQAF